MRTSLALRVERKLLTPDSSTRSDSDGLSVGAVSICFWIGCCVSFWTGELLPIPLIELIFSPARVRRTPRHNQAGDSIAQAVNCQVDYPFIDAIFADS